MKKDSLSVETRHEIFCREFIIDFNATRAAEASGFSKKGARQQGSRLLSNENIRKRVDELIKQRKARVEFTAENVLTELARLAFSNMKDYVKHADDKFVYFKSIDDIPDELAAAIESMEMTDKGIKVRLHNKEKALELALKHFGLITEKFAGEVTHKHDIDIKKLRKAVNAIRGKGNNRKS